MHGDLAEQIYFMGKYNEAEIGHSTLRSGAKNGFIFPQFYGDYYLNNAKGLCQWAKLSYGKWKPGQGIDFGTGKIADHLISKGITNFDDFAEHIKEIEYHFWHVRFAEYGRWKKRHIKLFQKRGYLDLLTGFRCWGPLRQNQIINYPVQGAAFHCLLWSIIQVTEFIKNKKWKTKVIGQIHDAIVLDVYPPEREAVCEMLRQIMTVDLPAAWDWIIVPLQVKIDVAEIDRPWSEMH